MSAPTYTVLHRDETLVVVDKAPFVLTVSHGGGERCLLDDLRRDGLPVAPVHRLDRETSGALLLCLDKSRRAALEDAFRLREVEKDYLALVRGVPASKRAVIDVPIRDLGASAQVDRRGQRAVTRYEVLEVLRGASLLRASMETGRHNQVRVHMAHIGHPLLGDGKFGRRQSASSVPDHADGHRVRALLHAERLALRHPVTGKRLEVRCDPPGDFSALLAALRR